ncbi:SGNH/GDSL hydrolase family protein [Amycolatopsis suaedae]|uniref:SGNH/GDSL hydrolase family protein n=1 Tax=Amycolatopsis suaedae TaxID=2510978 RepID=A0A4Q7IXB0_9PSEU|nr:SGNH/GDSL hydrolase family protein [Amycolatopsis suaedae]RZQ59581.1 SGNH/GDSL hydrolase family protein [Amycolatopsis suaedae]
MRRRIVAVAAGVLLALTGVAAPATAAGHGPWVASWATAAQEAATEFGPNWSVEGFERQSLRQVVRASAGGLVTRVRLTNVYGTKPLRVAKATIARTAEGAAVRPDSVRPLTFGHRRSVEIPVGEETSSDLTVFRVAPLERVTITLYLAEATGPATMHLAANTTSYRAAGDHVADADGAAFTETSQSWYLLAGLDVAGQASRGSGVVTFGDSITDGAGATFGEYDRYPDDLAEALTPRPVLNTGIGGNRVLNDARCAGERAAARFERDVLDQPRAGTVIVLEGINDIGMPELPGEFPCVGQRPVVTAEQLIAGHRQLIRMAKADGMKIIGATMLPYQGTFYYSERGEAVRDAVNAWIRTSGEYDAVADFDRITADPAHPDALLPAYDSGDKLHPSDAGYAVMATEAAKAVRSLR